MSDFSLAGVLDSRRGEDLELWARTINPQFVRVLRTIGFDRTWARAEGTYLYDGDGARFLDLLGGFGMYGVGRNNPRLALGERQRRVHGPLPAAAARVRAGPVRRPRGARGAAAARGRGALPRR